MTCHSIQTQRDNCPLFFAGSLTPRSGPVFSTDPANALMFETQQDARDVMRAINRNCVFTLCQFSYLDARQFIEHNGGFDLH